MIPGNFRWPIITWTKNRVHHVARANIKILLLIVVQIVPMGKNRPLPSMQIVKIVVQGNTVFQPNCVKIAEQENIAEVQTEQIVNVILASRVDIHRKLGMHDVLAVVQVNTKILPLINV